MPPAGSSRAAMAAPTSDRRQSARQGRTSVTRPTNYYARTFTGRMAALGGMDQTPPASNNTPGFLPALTHFTNAVDAFPKELIKHFSMFKEVEAKIHDPEHVLQLLLAEIEKLPNPTISQRQSHLQLQASLSRTHSINGSVNGSIPQDGAARHQQLSIELFPADLPSLPPEEQAELRKRQLFFRLRMVIASMLPTLDEKLVVLTAAKTTKDKSLARMNSSYPHIDGEISEEARYGSLNHWAYADKEEKKKGERQRREVVSANTLANAAQLIHDADSIAEKSRERRDAMLANKRNRHQHVDSDFDERPTKKQTKARKLATEPSVDKVYGLGISSHGNTQGGRKKKTERATAAAAPAMERSLSSALQNAGAGGRNGTSPRNTPGAEGGKRKAKAPPAQAQPRKRAAMGAHSPPIASSPLASTFATSRDVLAAAQRPQSARARKNSTTNSVASAAPEPPTGRRPSSSHSVRHSNNTNAIQDQLEQAAGINRDNLSVKGASTPKEPSEANGAFESSNLKHEEIDIQEPNEINIDQPPPQSAPVTTRAGRTSKTATPIVGTFAEVPMARSRSTRNANNGANSHASSETSGNNSVTAAANTSTKRSHKKRTASISQQPPAQPPPALDPSADSTPASSPAPEISDPEAEAEGEDGDEPRYCYCNEVSYGNMIACDNDECPREWFHLDCVNMEKAPSARAKWYCSDVCREIAQRARGKGSAGGGRPGSSRQ